MEQYKFINYSKEERNDIVFDKTFNLLEAPYQIRLHPKVKFWRLGLRLSSVSSIVFPSSSRHTHGIETAMDLQIAVGQLNEQTKEWHTPNKIEFSWYDKNGILTKLDQREDYVENSDIEFIVKYDEADKKLLTSFTYGDFVSPDFSINMPGFTIFKLFAWAEYAMFEIDCLIDIYYDDATSGRIVFLGEPAAGKTSLISRLVFDSYEQNGLATAGLSIVRMEVGNGPQDRRLLTLLDFGGQERFSSISNIFLSNKNI